MPRKVKVVTTCLNEEFIRGTTEEKNLKKAVGMLDAFKNLKPDLVCLPEIFIETGVQKPASNYTSDAIIEILSEKAKDLNSYIIAGGYEVIDDVLYNVAWLIDRAGNLAGRYIKYYPTDYELEKGIRPGREVPVFETDFGRIGILICFDIDCPTLWDELAGKGAEMVVWISAYDGGYPLQAYASSKFYYVISSVRTNHSKIIDKTGVVLNTSTRWQGWANRVIDLEKTVFHIDGQHGKLLDIVSKLGQKVTIESFCEENRFTIESHDSQWPVERIQQEFQLKTFHEYHHRTQQLQNRYR